MTETSAEISDDPSQSVHIEEKYETRLLRLFQNLKTRLPELVGNLQLQASSTFPVPLNRLRNYLDLIMREEILNPGAEIIAEEVNFAFNHGQKFGELNLFRTSVYPPVNMPPYQKRTVEVLRQRNMADLKGITEDSSKRIIATITDGMLAGRDFGEVTEELDEIIETVSINRARVMVRTETMRAVNEGVRDKYQSLKIEKFERLEAMDERTCTDWEFVIGDKTYEGCAGIDGKIFTAEEAAEIDAQTHPNCRGTWIPVSEEVPEEFWEEVEEEAQLQGGEGSGNFGHAGRPGLVGGSSPGDAATPPGGGGAEIPKPPSSIDRMVNPKVERAKRHVKLMTPEKRKISIHSELIIAEVVNGQTTKPGFPIDVLVGKWAIEVKTVFPGAKEKMTMHGMDKRTGFSSIDAKRMYVKNKHPDYKLPAGTKSLKGASVMRVLETGRYYWKEGFGSFRSSGMEEVTLEQLAKKVNH